MKTILPGTLGLALALAGCGTGGSAAPKSPAPAAAPHAAAPATAPSAPTPTASNSIHHVFVIVKENHSFDNFFASFPGANGASSAVDSTGQTVAFGAPWYDLYYAGSNGWDAAHFDYDGGAMDRFDLGETIVPLVSPKGPFVTYDGSGHIDYYAKTARSGVLCDAYFTSVMGPSTPNHFYLLAATSARAISNPDLAHGDLMVLDPSGTPVSHPGSFSAAEIPTTLPNELEAAGLTWAYWCEKSLSNVFEEPGDGVDMIAVFQQLPSFPTNFVSVISDYDVNLGMLLSSGPIGNVTLHSPGGRELGAPALGRRRAGRQVDAGDRQPDRREPVLGGLRDLHHLGRLRWILRPRAAAPGGRHGARVPRAVPRRVAVRAGGRRRPHGLRALLDREVLRDRIRAAGHDGARRGGERHDGGVRLRPAAAAGERLHRSVKKKQADARRIRLRAAL